MRTFWVALAVLFLLLVVVPDAAANITDCKHCTYTCSNQAGYYTCYENCIRMSPQDCTNYNLQCKGACYTYYHVDAFVCRLMDYYPCYA